MLQRAYRQMRRRSSRPTGVNPMARRIFGGCRRRSIAAGAVVLALFVGVRQAPGAPLEIFNPDWSITLTDYGYSDLLFDQRPGFEGREYLSGEWGAAYSYKVGDTPRDPTWLEPHFIAPNWLTNSNFTVATSIAGTGVFNASGFERFRSIVSNGELGVRMFYEFIDTLTGTPQGMVPKSAGGPGGSQASSRYVLLQTYEVRNLSEETISGLQAFQFLHGLHSTRAVYDDRPYPGPLGAHHFDVSLRGLSDMDGYTHDDVIAMHSTMTPSAWEVGRYGIEGIDSHVVGKPSVGVHLSIEADALSGVDLFDLGTPPLWVGGAMRWTLPDLEPGEIYTYDVLLSLSTVTVPEPSTLALAGIGALAWAGIAIRRRRGR